MRAYAHSHPRASTRYDLLHSIINSFYKSISDNELKKFVVLSLFK